MAIEFRHLRYFVAVAEELHFGRAAERLHMAQSPLSHQIIQLERELGLTLLDRDHHVVGLTDAGRAFLPEAVGILQALERAMERTRRAASGLVGAVVIGYVAEVTAAFLPLSLQAYRATHPQIEIDLRPGTTGFLLDLLADGEVDVAFVRSPGVQGGLHYEELVAESLYVALPASHHPADTEVSLSDLKEEPFVLPSFRAARGLRVDIDSACTSCGFTPRVVREAESLTAALLLVAAGTGVALIPSSAAHAYPIAGVKALPLIEATATSAGLAWKWGRESEVVAQFLETARAVAAGRGAA